jgi:two-component system sensor histidine kinase DegS
MSDAAAAGQPQPQDGGTSIDFPSPGGEHVDEIEHTRRLLEATERRLARLGFDLHDGPLQDLSALAAEVRYLCEQVVSVVPTERTDLVHGRFDDVLGRITTLDDEIRQLVRSLEPRSLPDLPLRQALAAEVAAFQAAGETGATLQLAGELHDLTRSQQIAVLRVVQEALANVREHSGAGVVEINVSEEEHHVRITVVDDGRGFRPQAALRAAERQGRLGVVGMAERVRLLGGSFNLESAPGGPTSVTALVPRWRPDSA